MCVGIKGPGICVGSQFTRHGQAFLCMVDDKRTCPVPYPLGFHFVCAWWLRFTSLFFLPSFLPFFGIGRDHYGFSDPAYHIVPSFEVMAIHKMTQIIKRDNL